MRVKVNVLYFFVLTTLSIIVTTPCLIVSAQTEEEVIETIIKGVSYNESFLKNANFELTFEYYKQGESYDIEAVKAYLKEKAEKRGFSPQEIEKALKEEEERYKKIKDNPSISGSSRNIGKAVFLIKDNQIRIDREYTQTRFKGPVDPHSDLKEEKYSELLSRQTDYYSPGDSYTFFSNGKKLIINQGPQNFSILPLKFGLEWDWSKNEGEVQLFSNLLKTLLKEGKLKLAGQEEINGNTYYVLEVFTPGRNQICRWWIDPAKGYTVSKKVISIITEQESEKREFILMERTCTVKNLTGDVWIPETGIEKYYQLIDLIFKKLDKPNYKKLDREERIKVTNCVLDTVTDKDVVVPDIDSGKYKSIVDMKTGELINISSPDTGINTDVKSPDREEQDNPKQ